MWQAGARPLHTPLLGHDGDVHGPATHRVEKPPLVTSVGHLVEAPCVHADREGDAVILPPVAVLDLLTRREHEAPFPEALLEHLGRVVVEKVVGREAAGVWRRCLKKDLPYPVVRFWKRRNLARVHWPAAANVYIRRDSGSGPRSLLLWMGTAVWRGCNS